MSDNNLQQTTVSREQKRDHVLSLSITESDWDQVEAEVAEIKQRTGRRVVPIASAAYEIFRRGLAAQVAA